MDNSWNIWANSYKPFFEAKQQESALSDRAMSSQQAAELQQQMGLDDIVAALQKMDLDQEDDVTMSDGDSGFGSPSRQNSPTTTQPPPPGFNTTFTTTMASAVSPISTDLQQRTGPCGSPSLDFRGALLHGFHGTGTGPAPNQHYTARMADTGREFGFRTDGLPSFVSIPPPTTISPRVVSLKPWGIAVHSITRDIFVTDRDIPEIRRYIYQGGKAIMVQRITEPGLRRPTGIAVDSYYNRIIVADKDNHRITIFRITGSFLMSFGKEGHRNGEFNRPWDVAVSPNGNFIAVADSRNHRIQLFDSNGNFLRKFTVYEVNPFIYKTEFDYPRGITFDRTGTKIYVTDFNIRNVFVFDLALTEKHALAPIGALTRPQGLTESANGNLIICDAKDNCIKVISPSGLLIKTVRALGPNILNEPVDVANYGDGLICVLEASGKIHIWN